MSKTQVATQQERCIVLDTTLVSLTFVSTIVCLTLVFNSNPT